SLGVWRFEIEEHPYVVRLRPLQRDGPHRYAILVDHGRMRNLLHIRLEALELGGCLVHAGQRRCQRAIRGGGSPAERHGGENRENRALYHPVKVGRTPNSPAAPPPN